MKCPCCKKQLKIPVHAELNMETYHNSAIVRTQCCHQLVQTFPKFSYTATKYDGHKEKDDWGN